jgi:2-phosphosulfolactate phosphatase
MRLTRKPKRVPSVQLDWGVDGVRFALKNNDIVVIVDALRFSTAVTTAVDCGFTIFPVGDREQGKSLARSIGAEMSGRPGKARYTISPFSYMRASSDDNHKVVLFSPNGAACTALAGIDDTVYIGCFLNARAVGKLITEVAGEQNKNVTVIAAGEQRAIDTGERIVYDREAAYPVFAIEDYLASGAIISYCGLRKSAEAELCQLTFVSARNRVEVLLFESFSGRYLVQNGLGEDISHAARLNSYDAIPVLRDGNITKL